MTVKELSQLYFLKREIEMDWMRLEELRAKIDAVPSPRITGMPHSTTVESRVEWYVAELVDLTADIKAKRKRCQREKRKLESYINGISDSLVRQIFTLRFEDGLTWDGIAKHFGRDYTAAYVRNISYKFLRGTKKNEKKEAKT
jgi:hypothetical protein